MCAVAWLVAHVRMLGLDEREKSLQMIRQLAGPLYSENTLQFYNERSVPRPRQVCGRESAPPGTNIPPHALGLRFPGSRSATTSSSIQAPTSPPCLAAEAVHIQGSWTLAPSFAFPYHSLAFLVTHSLSWLSRCLVCVSVSRGF